MSKLKKIFFFSNNVNKIKEINELFRGIYINVLSTKDLGINIEPKENGLSFAENAKIKSTFGYESSKIPCFADDSGICIEALGWKPNIFSKRFIDSFKNYNECFNYIIDKVKKSKKDKAYFKTSICLTLKTNYHIVFEGKVGGKISKTIKGQNGFGYDPIFIPNGFSKTYGEIGKKEKNILSHRSIATNKLINFFSN